MSSANGYTIVVQNRGHIVWMESFKVKGDDPTALLCLRSVDLEVVDQSHLLERILCQVLCVGPDSVHPQPLQVLDGRGEPNALGNGGRPGLELPGEIIPTGTREGYFADHVAAIQKRLQVFQNATLPV